MLNISLSLLIIIVFLNFSVGFLILSRDKRNKTNIYFFLFTLILNIWILANYFENEPMLGDYRVLLLKLDYAAAVLASVFFYLFCLNFPEARSEKLGLRELATYLLSVPFIILSFTGLIIGEAYYEGASIDVIYGPLFFLYFIFIFLALGQGLLNLAQKYRKASGARKIQIYYVFLGLLISSFFVFAINLVIASFFSVPLEIMRFGIYGLLFFCIFTAFAIAKYHLFEIRLIITEVLVVSLGIILLGDVFNSPGWSDFIWKAVIFAVFVFFGLNLIRAAREENKRREEAEIIAAEERSLREEAERLAADLKRLDEAKTQFILSTQHHLRGPLTVVQGYLSMMGEGSYGKINAKASEKIKACLIETQRMIKIVNDFLDVAKYQMGKGGPQKTEVDMVAMIAEIVADLAGYARERKLYLKLEKGSGLIGPIMADRPRLKEAFYNIIDNAIKYTEQGGVTVMIAGGSDKFRVAISDTGIGMEGKEKDNVFNRTFERGERAKKVYATGKGIGLYLAAQIIASHGGAIRVESEGRDKGSAFFIELPIGIAGEKAKTGRGTKN